MTKYWEQDLRLHKGATRAYLRERYGSGAFNEDGTIKESILDEAINHAKAVKDTKWERRLVLARTFKTQARMRE